MLCNLARLCPFSGADSALSWRKVHICRCLACNGYPQKAEAHLFVRLLLESIPEVGLSDGIDPRAHGGGEPLPVLRGLVFLQICCAAGMQRGLAKEMQVPSETILRIVCRFTSQPVIATKAFAANLEKVCWLIGVDVLMEKNTFLWLKANLFGRMPWSQCSNRSCTRGTNGHL